MGVMPFVFASSRQAFCHFQESFEIKPDASDFKRALLLLYRSLSIIKARHLPIERIYSLMSLDLDKLLAHTQMSHKALGNHDLRLFQRDRMNSLKSRLHGSYLYHDFRVIP